mmetsp:Transcript_17511/g.33197  ORF Transcript_17511/g.33197 Transcript_17511/m.33197 type:complete len:883 (+) Transcript_17511:1648-4296(+)
MKLLFNVLLLGILLVSPILTTCESEDDPLLDSSHDDNAPESKRPVPKTKSMSKHEQRISLARKRWKKTFEEIKSLVVDFTPETNRKGRNVFEQWKLLLDGENQGVGYFTSNRTVLGGDVNVLLDTSEVNGTESSLQPNFVPQRSRQRFDGFANWERLLQQWADDAAAYSSRNKQHDKSRRKTERSIRVALVPSESKSSSPRFTPRPAKPEEPVLPHTDIGDKSKSIWIVTTAALPWMTGTAVNPLLRAAYLTHGRKEAGGKVTLMLPWLEREKDRDKVYGKDRSFDTCEDQEEWIRTWLREKAGMKEASELLNIAWYIGRHETQENSIYSMGDITAMIPVEDADICVLEEPEHLNWYRAPGESWTTKFKHVVGIVHTNYFVYAQEQPAAYLRAPGMRLLTSWMCRAHCHRIIKLSGTLGKFAPEKELVENVHGVRKTFLDYGSHLSQLLKSPSSKSHPVFGPDADPKVYFIGKMLWSKGIGSLMELLKYAEDSADLKINVDMYGGGPDLKEAQQRSEKLEVSMQFHGPIDHAALASTHKIFVNPSLSEVLCTTVAEALAMGKFVVVPSHPSNDFFAQFPNCLTYANKEEFVGNLYYALTHSPEPLSEEYLHALSWEAANERFIAAGCIAKEEADEFASVIASDEAGIEIGLPPLIEDEERRKKVSMTVKNTRDRYREFRAKLSQEVRQSNVLPADLQNRMLTELDKRLDLDLDELLSSPKLRVQLSPAELDKQLLDLYKAVSENPGADLLRTVMGGANVGRQSLYLKQQAQKAKARSRSENGEQTVFPQFLEDVGLSGDGTATKWIKRTLRRNLQQNASYTFLPDKSSSLKSETSRTDTEKEFPKMMLSASSGRSWLSTSTTLYVQRTFTNRVTLRIPSLLI